MAKTLIRRISIAVDPNYVKNKHDLDQGKDVLIRYLHYKTSKNSIQDGKGNHIDFIDFEKSFDSIHRDSLWKIVRLYGIPQHLIDTVKWFLCQLQMKNWKH